MFTRIDAHKFHVTVTLSNHCITRCVPQGPPGAGNRTAISPLDAPETAIFNLPGRLGPRRRSAPGSLSDLGAGFRPREPLASN